MGNSTGVTPTSTTKNLTIEDPRRFYGGGRSTVVSPKRSPLTVKLAADILKVHPSKLRNPITTKAPLQTLGQEIASQNNARSYSVKRTMQF